MKKLVAFLIIYFLTIQLSAQDAVFPEKELNNQNRFYADLISKAATLNGKWGLFGGVRAGYNLNKDLSVGLIAHGLIPERLGNSYINQTGKDELHLGYGGAEMIYNHNFSDKFYLTGMLMIGAGRVDYQNKSNDYFFISEPGASLNYKIVDWFGVGYSINYRFASGVKYSDFTNASFSGWSTDLNFKFVF